MGDTLMLRPVCFFVSYVGMIVRSGGFGSNSKLSMLTLCFFSKFHDDNRFDTADISYLLLCKLFSIIIEDTANSDTHVYYSVDSARYPHTLNANSAV